MAIKIVRPTHEAGIDNQAVWVSQLYGDKKVLDVGGAQHVLRCATHVVDILPYDKRQRGRGPEPERFTDASWYQFDINNTPWPWADDEFDYVWCSQVVEDIRDPIGVCREMQRVAKEGFISTVQRQYESHVTQADGVVGYHHHRWLVEIQPELDQVTFTFKSPILHVDPTMRPPAPGGHHLLHFEWTKPFIAREVFLPEGYLQREELETYLREQRWLE